MSRPNFKLNIPDKVPGSNPTHSDTYLHPIVSCAPLGPWSHVETEEVRNQEEHLSVHTLQPIPGGPQKRKVKTRNSMLTLQGLETNTYQTSRGDKTC